MLGPPAALGSSSRLLPRQRRTATYRIGLSITGPIVHSVAYDVMRGQPRSGSMCLDSMAGQEISVLNQAVEPSIATPGPKPLIPWRETWAEMLDCLEQGLFVLDRGATVVFANRSAAELLAEGAGLCVQAGRLCGAVRGETIALHRLVAGCAPGCAGPGGSLALSREMRGAPLFLVVAPLSIEVQLQSDQQGVAMVFVTDPGRKVAISIQQLRDGFRLTPAEAAVALELIEGDGLRAVATRLGISLGTVRTHLSQVFAKTGTRRQAELVRLVLASRPNVRGPGGWAPYSNNIQHPRVVQGGSGGACRKAGSGSRAGGKRLAAADQREVIAFVPERGLQS